VSLQPGYGTSPFPPLGTPATFQVPEEDPEPVKYVVPPSSLTSEADVHKLTRAWKAKQKERIKARDDASELKRQETIRKAEESIDTFYAEYNAKKEKHIAENKYVSSLNRYRSPLTPARE
jgi:hypothetical protein